MASRNDRRSGRARNRYSVRKQRGFVQLYLYLIAGAFVLAALAWGVRSIYQSGREAERKVWEQREAKITADANEKVRLAQQRLIAQERAHAAALTEVSADYQRKLQENVNAKDRVIAGLRDGSRKLFVSARCPNAGGVVSGAPAGAGGRDGDARAELSGSAAEFLVAIASEADAVVRQLSACQAVIAADRKR